MKEKAQAVRVYSDTSVYGGAFDEPFAPASRAFFSRVRRGVFALVVSELVDREISRAPGPVIDLFNEMLVGAEIIAVEDEAIRLQQAYLASGIVTPKFANDALHVALASVS